MNDGLLRWWPLVEADFQREYGMDLMAELTGKNGRMLGWRRFSALVAGLSGESAFRAAMEHERSRPVVLEGEAAARHVRAWLKS